MGTTRKDAKGIPNDLLKLKEAKRHLVWDSVVARVVGKCLVFLWQDNSVLIAISTAHSLYRQEDRTEVNRRRPRVTDRNRTIIIPVFSTESVKKLDIPAPIDDYNHGMNGVDIANQLRSAYSCARPLEAQWPRVPFYYLVDTAVVNAFLINRTKMDRTTHREHSIFFDELWQSLCAFSKYSPQPGLISTHPSIRLKRRHYCAYGKRGSRQAQECLGTNGALKEIVNGVRRKVRSRQTYDYCGLCKVHLCADRPCWNTFHSSL